MNKERILKIARNIILLSAIGLVAADLFLAYYIDAHNQSGLLNFGYFTNLTFLLSFSCPIFYIILSVVNFIKEEALFKCGEGRDRKRKFARLSFFLMLLFIFLYALATKLPNGVAAYVLLFSIISFIASIISFFIYTR